MFAPSQLVAPGIPKQVEIPKPIVSEPPCLIMLGGLGDLLITLPVAWHYAQQCNVPTPILTSAKLQNVLSGCSYVKSVGYDGAPWRGYREAIEWAKARYKTVCPLHVGDAEIRDNPKRTHFCHEQYLHAGVDGRYGEFPLIFDKRNPNREAALVTRIRGKDSRPLFLYNVTGNSSPFSQADRLISALTEKWRPQLHFVNVSSLDLSYFQDLLAVLDVSVGMLSIDTSTIHLMPASKTPYIALCNDTKGEWWSSVPRGNCPLRLGYTETIPALTIIHDVIADMVAGCQIKTISQEAIRSFIGKSPIVEPKPHLITLACNGMESVWKEAYRTWEPWLRSRGLNVECLTKLIRKDLAPAWNKIPLVLAALEKHSEVWWVDADITVARPDAVLPTSDADLLFATDWNGLCAGMYRARSTEWTKAFLNAALLLGDVRDNDAFGKDCGIKWEQNTFKALLRDFPSCGRHVAYLPRTFMSEVPLQAKPGVYSFYHFGAMKNAQRIKAIRLKHRT